MDSVAGVYFPDGGIAAIPHAMAAAAEKAGVEFRYDTPVRQVLHGSEVRGVLLADGRTIEADAVVVNADLPGAYDLLPQLSLPTRLRRPSFSPSALVWHVGVRGLPAADVAHHNIHFAADWESAFRSLLRDGRMMPDPSVLVSVPSVTDPSLAPAGSSTLYVLEPVPNLAVGKVDWSRERGATRERLAARLRQWGYPSEVVAEEVVDPHDWARQGMGAGTPFSLAHRFFQSGPFRPSNVDRRVRGLVFVGTGTVPGVGVPMVLVSGRLAAERVDAL
jgi:phytoene desaturase